MANDINRGLTGTDTISALLDSESFVDLDSNLQNKIIDAVYNDKKKDGGYMGKFFGTKNSNAAMHIGFIVCVLLVVVLIIDFIHSYVVNESINMELVNVIIPVITLFLGYIFGKGSNN